jgi:hypothetical protein
MIVTFPLHLSAVVGMVVIWGGMAVGNLIGRTTYQTISGLFNSNIWIEKTERHTYKAPDGHEIIADPTY